MKKIQLILAAASLFGATSLDAQAKKTELKEKRAEESCTTNDGVTSCRIYRFKEDSSLIKRAAIGVSVQTTGTKRDTIGVFIARVTPDGPAEKAGIVEGERIAAVNGVDLRVDAADVDDSYTAGIASHRLTRELQKLTPGALVTLRVVSGGRSREVQVTTVRASELMKEQPGFGMVFPRMPSMPSMPHMKIFRENMDEMTHERIIQAPSAAPVVVPAKPARISGTINRSI